MSIIYNILKQLEETSSTKEKEAILNTHKDNYELREFFRLALNDTCFFIKQIPEYGIRTSSDVSLTDAMNALKNLSSRFYTGHAGIQFLSQVLSSVDVYTADVLIRIIKKDPNCGVSDKTANKVWKGLIGEMPYMRCESFKRIGGIRYPALIQTKSDGMFANIFVYGDTVIIKSRNGKTINLLGIFEDKVGRELLPHYVYHGELLVMRNGRILDRKTGNGILNKAIKGTITEAEAQLIVCCLWDMMPIADYEMGKCTKRNIDRFSQLKGLIQGNPNFVMSNGWTISIIDHAIVNNLEQATAFYQEQLDEGNEGAVIKNLDGIWENKTSKDCVKMKPDKDCDLLCYDIIPHKKDPTLIGSLRCKSADGRIIVDVGSGLNDEMRVLPKSYFVGKICAVKFINVIDARDREELSLYLPRIIEVREDKNVADTFEYITNL